MPREAAGLDIIDPHLHSMQWSRRFTGLKLFLSLLVAGWDGYADAIRHQTEMGRALAEKLRSAGWTIANNTRLPVVCFVDPSRDSEWHHQVAMRLVSSGRAWISTTVLGGTRTVLRACITNYKTNPNHLDELIAELARAAAAVS
jgi:glutamate/tyrosine decarboxylase-like PLP-dependent enzyme